MAKSTRGRDAESKPTTTAAKRKGRRADATKAKGRKAAPAGDTPADRGDAPNVVVSRPKPRRKKPTDTVMWVPDEKVTARSGAVTEYTDATITTKADGTRVIAYRVTETVPAVRPADTETREEASRRATLMLGSLMGSLRKVTDAAKELLMEHAGGCRCRMCVCGWHMEEEVHLAGRMAGRFADSLQGF